jgi:hypothetical protein
MYATLFNGASQRLTFYISLGCCAKPSAKLATRITVTESVVNNVKYYNGHRIKEDEIGEVCSTHGRGEKCIRNASKII